MLRVIPLGGLGEVGLNTMVIEHGDERLLIDAGLLFPRADMHGVEIVVPDYSFLQDLPERLTGIVLTHAHEDHIGALPYLLREVPVPVYGTPFTLAVARHKLEEQGVRADLRAFGPGESFRLGTAFKVEPVRVTHSVPDAVGLVVRTPSGTIVHTGDFKLDAMPIDGQLTDLRRLGEVAEEGVTALLSDSTNAEVLGTTGSEQLVRESFARIVKPATGRVIVAMFGSHLHRVQHLLWLAQETGRKVVIAGRSLQRNVELARQEQILKVPDGLLVAFEEAPGLAPGKTLILCTGAQAEPRSALSQMVNPEPGTIRVGKGDLVVLSSRTIPGNEMLVTGLINRLLMRGATVVTANSEPGIHVSGHASRDEQRKMIEVVRPRHFIPIHGEYRHLLSHRGLALECGLTPEQALLLTNGDLVDFGPGGGFSMGHVRAGQLMMKRDGMLPLSPSSLAERKWLAETGLVFVVVVLEQGGGKIRSGPTVVGQGLQAEEQAALGLAAEGAKLALDEVSNAVRGDDERVREELVRGVRRVFKQLLGTRPQVLPLVVRL